MISSAGHGIRLFGSNYRIVEISVACSVDGGPDCIDLKLLGDSSGIRPPSHWVSCGDELPGNDSPVICSRGGIVKEAVYWGPEDGWSVSPEPDYWTTMPEPPES